MTTFLSAASKCECGEVSGTFFYLRVIEDPSTAPTQDVDGRQLDPQKRVIGHFQFSDLLKHAIINHRLIPQELPGQNPVADLDPERFIKALKRPDLWKSRAEVIVTSLYHMHGVFTHDDGHYGEDYGKEGFLAEELGDAYGMTGWFERIAYGDSEPDLFLNSIDVLYPDWTEEEKNAYIEELLSNIDEAEQFAKAAGDKMTIRPA